MNANLNTVIGSGLCEVSVGEMTAVDGGHPAVRVGLFILGYAAEKVMDELSSAVPACWESISRRG